LQGLVGWLRLYGYIFLIFIFYDEFIFTSTYWLGTGNPIISIRVSYEAGIQEAFILLPPPPLYKEQKNGIVLFFSIAKQLYRIDTQDSVVF